MASRMAAALNVRAMLPMKRRFSVTAGTAMMFEPPKLAPFMYEDAKVTCDGSESSRKTHVARG